jgi:hypothetical protein
MEFDQHLCSHRRQYAENVAQNIECLERLLLDFHVKLNQTKCF